MKKIDLNTSDDLYDNFEDFINGEAKGKIRLVVPVLNINEWYGKNNHVYSIILGISQKLFEKIAYYETYVYFMEDGSYRFLNEKENIEVKAENPNAKILMGTEAIRDMLKNICHKDLSQKYEALKKQERECMAAREKMREEKEDDDSGEDFFDKMTEEEYDQYVETGKKLYETRKLINALLYFNKYGTERLIINEINVIPLNIRAMIKEEIDGAPYDIYGDLENLYVRIVSRNERLIRLEEMDAPYIIIRNEKRMLQEYVDALIHNGLRGKPVTRYDDKYACTSLTDIILRNTKMI